MKSQKKAASQLQPGDSIISRAPTRIDLAGGTIDLWPLYLFLKNPTTVNLAINLFAEAKIQILEKAAKDQGQVILRSEDQKTEIKLPWTALWKTVQDPESIQIQTPPSLELHAKLLSCLLEKNSGFDFSELDFDLVLSTQAKSPAGAGLGGSSTLSIAIIGALSGWMAHMIGKPPFDPLTEGEDYIEIVRDVETTVIQVPAGCQDYYSAMFGGLQSLQWGAGSHDRKHLSEELISELEDRILLFYSGQSRNSGINNWALFKGFIDKDSQIRTQFEQISSAACQLEKALIRKDWKSAGQAIASEWAVRRTLAAGITTPEIDQAFSEAQKLGSVAGKVCGAGGGGCFFIYLNSDSAQERTTLKTKIESLFAQQGLRKLYYRAVSKGVEAVVIRA
jgi:D-glycero-alpha-D-manno-heptose-7-phosphate kinase